MTGTFDYFVVFAEMRTGSNFLETNLNAFEEVRCVGEAFNPYFIGYPNKKSLFDITETDRNADPLRLLKAVETAPDALVGFRYFHDHDPRVFEPILNNPRCAKIILTRNPAESYVSWKIAQTTGQWKLTDVKRRKSAKATFEPAEFDTHIEALQAFQVTLLSHLQRTGQTAFYVSYEDLQSLDVMNGMAQFLGLSTRLDALDQSLKVQNPGALSDKVANFAEMEAALAGLDRYNLTRTPNFEPRRAAAAPSYVALANTPMMFLPIPGAPVLEVEDWLRAVAGGDASDLLRNMSQKDLRHWKRQHPGHRSFTVLRHPLARAHKVFCQKVMWDGPDARPHLRKVLTTQYGAVIPDVPADEWTTSQHRAAFEAFLVFLKANLSGQTATKVDPSWATQTAIVQGFANFVLPDLILREAEIAEDLAALAARVGIDAPSYSAPVTTAEDLKLSEIYDDALEKAARSAYQRDYMMFGFGPWQGR